MNPLEMLPNTWDDTRDGPFFAITSREFSPAFAAGASALLASYDEPAVEPAETRPAGAATAVPLAHTIPTARGFWPTRRLR
jgi:hypothetical protein